MSEQIIRPAARTMDVRAAMPWLVGAAIYALLIAIAPRLLADPDTYSHIALGRWILDNHTVPATDPFSATFRGTHWVAFEWLSQLTFAVAYLSANWIGVAALAAASVAAAFALLTRYLLRELQPTAALVAVLAAFSLTAPHILARPHILALPVMVAWVGALIRAADRQAAPPLVVLPLMTLWANLHGSFTFGLAIIAPIACDAIWRTDGRARVSLARQWAIFALLAFAAACLNPFGPEMILVTFRTAALGAALSTVTEWRPQDFTHLGSFEIIMLGAFAAALYRGVKLPVLRLAMVLGILHLSLAQGRHADLLGMLAPIFLARPLASQFAALSADERAAPARLGPWPFILTAILLLAVSALGAFRKDVMPAANITPANAVHVLRAATSAPILNDYNFGGYLDFVDVPPFIDGRAELYGEGYMLRHARAVNLQNLPDFLRLLDEYRIGATLLAPTTPAVSLLDRLPGWQRIYADGVAVVHIRRP